MALSSSFLLPSNGQVSKRTLDKQRKHLKQTSRPCQQFVNLTTKSSGQLFHQQPQQSLRYESLIKRKRTLELISQRLNNDKERLVIERKTLEIKLAVNENENERIAIEKRRIDLAIQKCHYESNGGVTANNLSDQDDHEDNNSVDEMSDINE